MQKLFTSKKGYGIQDIPTLAIIFGVGVIILSVVGQIVGEIKDTQTAGTAEYNISAKGQTGLIKVGNWFPTLGLVIGAVIIIGALFSFYAYSGRGK